MAKFASRAANITLNSVVLEDDLNSLNLDISQEAPETTSFADAGPRRVTGNYDWTLSGDGPMDFAASQSDATLFAMVGSAAVTEDFDPTGTAAGASNPHYTGSVILTKYSISAKLGSAVMGSFATAGSTALTRGVA